MMPSIAFQRRVGLALLRAPASVLRAVAGAPRRSPEGYEVDLQTQVVLRLNDWMQSTAWARLGVARARRLMDVSAKIFCAEPTGAIFVRERRIPLEGGTIGVRIYTPDVADRPLPVLVYYHGGGFVLGSLESHDGECRALALGARAIVVAVDYRLAPEHRFPTAALDGIAAFRWVAANVASFGGDPGAIAVGGDSAGGNIAAVVARETRGDAVAPIFQLLVYPVLDLTRSLPSHRFFREGFLLDEASMDWFHENYLRGHDDMHDPRASPLLAGDHAGVAPAMILTAGFDPLRDDGKAYADKLSAAGVPVEHRCYEGLIHGFFNMSAGIVAARRALDDAVDALARGLERGRRAPRAAA